MEIQNVITWTLHRIWWSDSS